MNGRKRKAPNKTSTKIKNKRVRTKTPVTLKQLTIPLERCDQIINQKPIVRNVCNIISCRTIEDMPTELLLKIFSYFSYTERKIISLVCKKWRIVCSDPLLNRYYTVGPGMSLRKVKEMLREAPYLKHFKIVMRKDLKSILYTLSKCNTNITNMKIEKCLQCKISTFIQLSKCCPRLKSLAINNTVVSYGQTFKCKNQLFENLQKLTTINSCVHDDGFQFKNGIVPLTTLFLIKLFQRCQNLKFIKVSLSQLEPDLLNDDFVRDICELTNYKLIGLCLDATQLTDRAIEDISLCKTLKVLKLATAEQLTIKSINKLKGFSSLRTLHLTDMRRVGKTSWKSLFSQPWMDQLECLNLSGTKRIDDNVLSVIAKNCKSLTRLKLANCRLITANGLAQIITSCNKLITLNIKDTRRRVAKSLSLIPQHLKKLKLLSCEKKHIKRYIRKELITSCPNLIIK